MKITRQKRLDRVIYKYGDVVVKLSEGNTICFQDSSLDTIFFLKSEIPNLIKALEEVSKQIPLIN